MNKIDKIRGIQYTDLLIFLGIFRDQNPEVYKRCAEIMTSSNTSKSIEAFKNRLAF